MLSSWPLAPSAFVYGIAFGTLATATGLTLAQALAMSALVFSGTAQIAAVSVWSSLSGVVPVMIIITVANVRYLLMSASLRPWLGDLPLRAYAPPLSIMVDSGYAAGMRAFTDGHRDAGHLLGPCLSSWLGWVAGTAVGVVSGSVLADPRVIALDFVVVGFCAVAVAAMGKGLRDVSPPLAAVIAVIVTERAGAGAWAVVIAALAAAIVAMLRWRPGPPGIEARAP
jgi:predicted branched-subunit amino acid permease